MMEKQVETGDVVIYHDPTGKAHNALVTCAWSPTCINLVVISSDEDKRDSYGRQIERFTSMTHKSVNQVHGFYWRFPEEEPNPYNAPVA